MSELKNKGTKIMNFLKIEKNTSIKKNKKTKITYLRK